MFHCYQCKNQYRKSCALVFTASIVHLYNLPQSAHKCKSCHVVSTPPPLAKELGTKSCTEKLEVRNRVGDNCYSCHMPQNKTTDIPHVITTDHFIRKPLKEEEVKDIREFIGIT